MSEEPIRWTLLAAVSVAALIYVATRVGAPKNDPSSSRSSSVTPPTRLSDLNAIIVGQTTATTRFVRMPS